MLNHQDEWVRRNSNDRKIVKRISKVLEDEKLINKKATVWLLVAFLFLCR